MQVLGKFDYSWDGLDFLGMISPQRPSNSVSFAKMVHIESLNLAMFGSKTGGSPDRSKNPPDRRPIAPDRALLGPRTRKLGALATGP